MFNLGGGRNISDDQHLNALLSNFSTEKPFKRKTYPSWDLIKVLKTLMEEPYEPLNIISLSFLTKKTVFLLFWASGLWRKLHAFDINPTIYYKDIKKLLLLPKDEFIAKNMNTKTGKGEFKGIELESLTDFTGLDLHKDSLLCPVRCVKEYMKELKREEGH